MAHEKAKAIILCVIMVFGAGCAGWGTDGPADDPNDDIENDTGDNVDPNESTNDTDDDNESPSVNDTDEGDNESPGPPYADENDSSDDGETDTSSTDGEDSDSSTDTDDSDSSESDDCNNECPTEDTQSSDGGEDESTDETGETGDGDSQTGTDDSEGDSDESDGEDSDEDDSSSDDSEEPEPHTLTVTVTDAGDNPIEDATVGLVEPDSGADVASGVPTDENGQATFEVPDGHYEVFASASGYGQPSDNRGVTVDGDTEYTVQMVDTGMYDYSATVQVVDEDGNALTNEQVEVQSPPGETADKYVTDENGEFVIKFQNSSKGDVVQHEVVVRDTSETIHIERGEQHEQITVSTDVERETHTLTVNSGEVYPVEGVDVTIERHADGATTTRTTDEEGQTTFEVYSGDYTVTGVDDRGEEYSEEVTVPDQQSVLLPHEVPTPDEVETTLTVVDESGTPVEGVTVYGMTSLPPHGADVPFESEATGADGRVDVTVHEGQTYGSLVVEDSEGNQYDHGGQTITTDGDGVTITVERPQQDSQQAQAAA